MAITLLNVAEIIKKPSGLVFIYDSDGKLLQTIKDTKEIRRQYYKSAETMPEPNTLGWKIQLTLDNQDGNNIEFEINNLTLVQYAAGKFQTYPDLGSSYELTEYYSKFESVYAYLANYVFLDCCETDPDNPIFAYPTNTYANWLIALNAGLLPKGLWIEVTAIPSQPSAIFSMFCTETNEIALGGFGQFLNADWQNVGDYSGVLALTTVPFTANIGQWYAGIEGTAIDGDVVIWNCLHYQVTDAAAFAGTDPAATPLAYTLLPKATANMGYITEVDQIEFVFVDDWLQYRADKRGNTYRYSKESADVINPGVNYIEYIQWGRNGTYGYMIDGSKVDILNTVLPIPLVKASNGASIFNIQSFGYIQNINSLNNASVSDIYADSGSSIYSIICDNGNISNLTAINSGQINDIYCSSGSNCNQITSQNLSFINQILINNSSIFTDILSDNSGALSFVSISDGSSYQNKTINGVSVAQFDIKGNQVFTESLFASNNISHIFGFSNDQRTIDITGLTTIDIGTNTEQVGIYNLTSGNATETINLISNFPTLFPFTLKPETGLTVTITFTAVGSLSANDEIVGQSVFVVLNGDNGDELTLQAATIGGYSVTEQVELNQNN